MWGRVLSGRSPFLSIESCYSYSPDHLGDGVNPRQLSDLKGRAVAGEVLALVRRLRPVHLALIQSED